MVNIKVIIKKEGESIIMQVEPGILIKKDDK
jgi:hypothetical protein